MTNLVKVTIRIDSAHRDRLSELHPNLGYNRVIRELIGSYIRRVDEKINKKLAPPTDASIQLEEIELAEKY